MSIVQEYVCFTCTARSLAEEKIAGNVPPLKLIGERFCILHNIDVFSNTNKHACIDALGASVHRAPLAENH